MKISACVIVKNEEKNLPRWLECMKHIADEMIVVDTGSTDGTVAIAEAAGANVFHFEWINDFAAAKNFAIDQASGNWIVFPDADEYIPSQQIPILKQFLQQIDGTPEDVGVYTPLINIDQDNHDAVQNSGYQLRVFRHHPDIRYSGRIHEAVTLSGKEHKNLRVLDQVSIYHTGYSSHIIMEKLQRNLRMLQEEIARRGEKPTDAIFLMDCYWGLQDFEKVLHYSKIAIKAATPESGLAGRPNALYINSLIRLGHPREEIEAAMEEAIEMFPNTSEFLIRKGIYLFSLREYLPAEKLLRDGLGMYDKTSNFNATGKLTSDNSRALLPDCYLALGMICQMRLKRQEALNCFTQALKLNPYNPNVLNQYINNVKKEPAKQLIQTLSSVYDKDNDAMFIVKALKDTPLTEVHAHFARFLKKEDLAQLKPYEKIMYQARYVDAADSLLESAPKLFELAIWSGEEIKQKIHDQMLQLILPDKYQAAWRAIREPQTGHKDGRQQKIIKAVETLGKKLEQ